MYTNPTNTLLLLLRLLIFLAHFEVISLLWSHFTCLVLLKDENNVPFGIPLRNHSDNSLNIYILSILDHTISANSPQRNLSYYNYRLLQIARLLPHCKISPISCNDQVSTIHLPQRFLVVLAYKNNHSSDHLPVYESKVPLVNSHIQEGHSQSCISNRVTITFEIATFKATGSHLEDLKSGWHIWRLNT